MADWRIGRGWTEAELKVRLASIRTRRCNFTESVEEMTPERGWHRYHSEAIVGWEQPGPPDEAGPFARARRVVSRYAFSDPRIVIAHFDPDEPLLGRRMLLEMRALRVLHYLAGVVVGATRSEEGPDETVFGFRYDTLQGHIEAGSEWFLLTKDHATGEIRFRIAANWRPGEFPNWWSRLGFSLLGRYYQKQWHHRAHRILAGFMRDPTLTPPEPPEGRLVHTNPEVIFERIKAHHV